MIQLLGQLVNQTGGYTITAGSANSTFVITTTVPADFTPSLAALRVNQLWFSSLVVTLITASFAMLVKQWLREYLSVDYTSPHERLRARQFRHPGLATWKVYEIAGFLPLLLQLALGLFFLGLCVFTWSINRSVGETSIVLVAGWVFLLLSATLAPLASPRCPYKTTFLKDIMVIIRRRIRSVFLPSPVPTGVRAVSHTIAVPAGACSAFLPESYLVEEIEAVKRDIDELAILKDVDSFLLDDDLLGTTIFDTLMQHNAPPPTAISFVLQVLSHRLRESFTDTQSLTNLPDLRQLTKRGWGAVSDIVANTIQRGLEKLSNPHVSNQWLEDAIRLILSLSDHQLTASARTALIRCIRRDSMPHFVRVIGSLRSETHDVQRHVVSRLYDLCTSVSSSNAPAEDVVALVLCLYGFELQVDVQQQNHFLLDLDSLSEDTWRRGSTTLVNVILHNLQTRPGVDSIGIWLEDAWSIILSRSRFSIPDVVLEGLTHCVLEETAPRFGDLVSGHLFSTDPSTTHITTSMVSLCEKLTIQDVSSAPHIISFCIHAFAKGQSAHFMKSTSVSPTLSHILDLRGLDTDLWLAATECIAGSLSRVLEKHVATDAGNIGSFYEDALYMLLSLSGSLAIPSLNSRVMVLGIERDEDTRLRLAQFICSLEAPASEHFPFVLSHLRRLCDLAVNGGRVGSGQVVQFLYHSLGHRLQGDILADPTASTILDLRKVPLEMWRLFINIVASALQDELRKPAADVPGLVIPWFKQAFSLLVSISEGSVSPTVCDVLIACLRGDPTQRTQLLQSVRALVPTDNIMLSVYVERLSAICKTLLSHAAATPDISSLVFAAINLDIPSPSASVLPKSFLDVKNLSRSAWTLLSEMLADILMTGLKVQGGSNRSDWALGSWSASVAFALLAISQHPIPPKAQDALIAYIKADDTVKTHFRQLIQSKTLLTQNHLTHVMRRILSLCGPLGSRTEGPTNVIRLLLRVLQNFTQTSLSSPLETLIDLGSLPQESWDLLNETILETVLLPIKDLKSETPGPWMEDAFHIVFSLSSYPLSPTVTEMVSRLCSDDYPYHRFSRFLQRHLGPASPHFCHGLARAHAIALCFADRYADINWFLRAVLGSVPCTSYCTHLSNTYHFGQIFYSHASVNDQWTRRYVLILVDLLKNLDPKPGPWPAGAAESFNALLSCPTPLRALSPEAAEVVFKIICWKSAIGGALSGIMSAAAEERTMVNNAAAIRTVTSLVVGANSHGKYCTRCV